MSMRDAFARAYKNQQWHNGSGSGSSFANTAKYRHFLNGYLTRNDIRSVLDAGCGDWQFSKFIDWSGVVYTGIDVVPELIIANSLKYETPAIRFAVADILDVRSIPQELVLVKDLLQHWPDAAVHELGRVLQHRRVLFTYDLDTGPHRDIAPGGYRGLDLSADPFCWPLREAMRYESVSHEGTVTRTKVVMELTP